MAQVILTGHYMTPIHSSRSPPGRSGFVLTQQLTSRNWHALCIRDVAASCRGLYLLGTKCRGTKTCGYGDAGSRAAPDAMGCGRQWKV